MNTFDSTIAVTMEIGYSPKYHVEQKELKGQMLLIEEAKTNPAKFEALYERYKEEIFRFIYQRIDDEDSAFDITQQVFLKAMENLPRYQFKGVPFGAWLYQIAKNELNLLFRKNKAQRTINIDDVDLRNIITEIQEDDYEPYYNRLADAIASLDEDALQLIEMRYFEKRPFQEIADILDITENNAKMKTYRVLEKLKITITNNK